MSTGKNVLPKPSPRHSEIKLGFGIPQTMDHTKLSEVQYSFPMFPNPKINQSNDLFVTQTSKMTFLWKYIYPWSWITSFFFPHCADLYHLQCCSPRGFFKHKNPDSSVIAFSLPHSCQSCFFSILKFACPHLVYSRFVYPYEGQSQYMTHLWPPSAPPPAPICRLRAAPSCP